MTKYSRALTALGAGVLAGVTFCAGAAQAAPDTTAIAPAYCPMMGAAYAPGPGGPACDAGMPLNPVHIMIITLSNDDWPISALLNHLHFPSMGGPATGGGAGMPGMPGGPGSPGGPGGPAGAGGPGGPAGA